MSIADLIAQGYGGYTGWTDEAAAAGDFAATGGAGKWTGLPGTSTSGDTRSAEGIDLSQVPSVQTFAETQIAGEDPYLQAILARMGEREDPLAMYTRLEEEAGVPTLRKAAGSLAQEINTLEDTIQAVEPSVSGRTRESLVTESQRQAMVTAERKPLREKLENFTRDLGRLKEMLSNAMAGIATKTELGLRGQEQALEPLKLQYTTLVDRNARILSGFTEDRQTKLDAMYDKLQRQRQLSDQDWELANQLASEERQYKMALQQAAATSGYKVTGSESIDQLLGIIGDKAAEQIAFDRAQATKGSASEREAEEARLQLKRDVKTGARHDTLMMEYGDVLPQWEISAAYNTGPMAEQFGPANVGMDIQNIWKLTQTGSSGSSDQPIRYTLPDGTVVEL